MASRVGALMPSAARSSAPNPCRGGAAPLARPARSAASRRARRPAGRRAQRDAAVLRQPLLGDVEARHDLEPGDERRVQRARRLDDVAQHAVDAEAHDRAVFVGLEVKVGRALAQRLQQQRVDHPDHGGLRAAVEQVLGRREVLHQPREVGFAVEVARNAGGARRRTVIGPRELGGNRSGSTARVTSGRCSTRFSSAIPSTVASGRVSTTIASPSCANARTPCILANDTEFARRAQVTSARECGIGGHSDRRRVALRRLRRRLGHASRSR